MSRLANFVQIVCLFLSLFARAEVPFNNPTSLKVFVSRSKPHTLVVIPEPNASAISHRTEYFISQKDCASYNELDQKELDLSQKLNVANELDINTSPTDIEAVKTRLQLTIDGLNAINAKRLSESGTIGGKIIVTYDFGVADKIDLIRKANPNWLVEVASLNVNNKQLHFAVPGSLPDSPKESLPFILDYSAGIFSASDLNSKDANPSKTMEIRNGSTYVQLLTSKRAACYDMQLSAQEKPFTPLFSMSISSEAYYAAFPSDYLKQAFGSLRPFNGTDEY